MRAVLDTNVFVSMVLGGQVGVINDYWKADKFILVISDDIVSEYLNVLSRPKLHLTADVVSTVLERVQRKAEYVTPTGEISVVETDPSDNKFLDAAAEAGADCLVSGDVHLLQLESFRGIPILTAREFIDRLSS
jgi:uncharacterized protein